MKKYTITQEQFENIDHYGRMFGLNADRIKDLCESEKDDIVYGFELGQMYSHLRDCFTEMLELTREIPNQEIIEKEK